MTVLSVNTVDYVLRDNKPVVILSCRDENYRKVYWEDSTFLPYFYVRVRDYVKFKKYLESRNLEHLIVKEDSKLYSGYDGVKYHKIYVQNPKDVRFLRDRLRKLSDPILLEEADVLFYIRYLVDRGIKTGVKIEGNKTIPVECESRLVYLVIDIEVDVPQNRNFKSNRPVYPVIIIGVYNSYLREYRVFYVGDDLGLSEYFVCCSDERDLLQKFIEYYRQVEPDCVLSFTPFDITYLINRLDYLEIGSEVLSPYGKVWLSRLGVHISCVEYLDISEMYRKVMGETKWETLDDICMREFGVGKRNLQYMDVHCTWRKNRLDVIYYNLRDVYLAKRLVEDLGLLQYFVEVKKIVGINLSDLFYTSRISDVMYLRLCHNRYVLATKQIYREKKRRYSGAVVFESRTGVYDKVLVLDWKSMYPSIIKTFNISFNTYAHDSGDIRIDETHTYISSTKGWTVQIIEDLEPLLDRNKDDLKKAIEKGDHKLVNRLKLKRLSIKEVVHGVYGFYGFAGDPANALPMARLYHPAVAESITLVGRIIQEEGVKNIVTKLGYTLVYGDTDSSFILLKEGTDEEIEYLRDMLQREVSKFIRERWGIEPKYFTLDVDEVYERMILKTKKRYVGLTRDGRVVYKGVEVVRREQADVTVEVQKTIFDMVLHGRPKSEVLSYVRRVYSTFNKLPLVKICPTVRVRKIPRHNTITYKALVYSNSYLGTNIAVGERFYMAYVLKVPPKYPSYFISPLDNKRCRVSTVAFKSPDILDGFIIDYSTLRKKVLDEKIKDILEICGIDFNSVFGYSLDDFVR